MRIYHLHGAELAISNQGIDFIFGRNNNYHQIRIAYLEFDKTLRKNGNDFNTIHGDSVIAESIRLINIAFVYAFSIATLNTTRSEEIEVNNLLGHNSTMK